MSQLIGDQTQSISPQPRTFESGQDLSFPLAQINVLNKYRSCRAIAILLYMTRKIIFNFNQKKER